MEVQVTSSNGTKWKGTYFTDTTPPPVDYRYDGWRCLHQAEGGYPNPDHMPIVRPSINIASVPFSEPLQWASYKINRHNPYYTGGKWRSTYNGGIAFTNDQGFDDPGAGPRVDYINREDIGSPLPKLMKGIICGGNYFTGTPSVNITSGLKQLASSLRMSITQPKTLIKVKGKTNLFQAVYTAMAEVVSNNILTMYPGEDAIDSTKPFSNTDAWAELILYNHWYFHATTRAGDRINNFPQGSGMPVYISYFLPKPAMYPLNWFTRWRSNELPDPLKIYKPL